MKLYNQIAAAVVIGLVWAAALPAAGQTTTPAIGYGYWEDVVLMNSQNPNYTARSMGIGGTQVGLGADISNASTNPAGLGMLRRNEFNISTSLLFSKSSNVLDAGTATTGNRSQFHIGTLGGAFSTMKSEIEGGSFRGGTFALTLTRLANFNSVRSYSTTRPYIGKDYNGDGSITKGDSLLPGDNSFNFNLFGIIADETRGPGINNNILSKAANDPSLSADQYWIRQAWGSFLLDNSDENNSVGGWYFNQPNGDILQSATIKTSGRIQQFDFAYGGNFNDKFYVGGGIGVPFGKQEINVTYDEQLLNVKAPRDGFDGRPVPDQSFWTGFVTRRGFNTKIDMLGINAKLGAIYKPTAWSRIGLSIQTPTAMAMSYEASNTLSADFGTIRVRPPFDSVPVAPGIIIGEVDRTNTYTYNATGPWRIAAGGTLLSSQYGFVTAEATYINYGGMKVRGKGGSNALSGDQALLSKNAQDAIQIRAGVEGKYDIHRFRVGGSYLPGAVATAADLVGISAGYGIRMTNFYLDLALNRYVEKDKLYTVINDASLPYFKTSPVKSDISNLMVQLTFGSYF